MSVSAFIDECLGLGVSYLISARRVPAYIDECLGLGVSYLISARRVPAFIDECLGLGLATLPRQGEPLPTWCTLYFEIWINCLLKLGFGSPTFILSNKDDILEESAL